MTNKQVIKSIWKPINELREDFEGKLIIKAEDGECGIYYYRKGVFLPLQGIPGEVTKDNIDRFIVLSYSIPMEK